MGANTQFITLLKTLLTISRGLCNQHCVAPTDDNDVPIAELQKGADKLATASEALLETHEAVEDEGYKAFYSLFQDALVLKHYEVLLLSSIKVLLNQYQTELPMVAGRMEFLFCVLNMYSNLNMLCIVPASFDMTDLTSIIKSFEHEFKTNYNMANCNTLKFDRVRDLFSTNNEIISSSLIKKNDIVKREYFYLTIDKHDCKDCLVEIFRLSNSELAIFKVNCQKLPYSCKTGRELLNELISGKHELMSLGRSLMFPSIRANSLEIIDNLESGFKLVTNSESKIEIELKCVDSIQWESYWKLYMNKIFGTDSSAMTDTTPNMDASQMFKEKHKKLASGGNISGLHLRVPTQSPPSIPSDSPESTNGFNLPKSATIASNVSANTTTNESTTTSSSRVSSTLSTSGLSNSSSGSVFSGSVNSYSNISNTSSNSSNVSSLRRSKLLQNNLSLFLSELASLPNIETSYNKDGEPRNSFFNDNSPIIEVEEEGFESPMLENTENQNEINQYLTPDYKPNAFNTSYENNGTIVGLNDVNTYGQNINGVWNNNNNIMNNYNTNMHQQPPAYNNYQVNNNVNTRMQMGQGFAPNRPNIQRRRSSPQLQSNDQQYFLGNETTQYPTMSNQYPSATNISFGRRQTVRKSRIVNRQLSMKSNNFQNQSFQQQPNNFSNYSRNSYSMDNLNQNNVLNSNMNFMPPQMMQQNIRKSFAGKKRYSSMKMNHYPTRQSSMNFGHNFSQSQPNLLQPPLQPRMQRTQQMHSVPMNYHNNYSQSQPNINISNINQQYKNNNNHGNMNNDINVSNDIPQPSSSTTFTFEQKPEEIDIDFQAIDELRNVTAYPNASTDVNLKTEVLKDVSVTPDLSSYKPKLLQRTSIKDIFNSRNKKKLELDLDEDILESKLASDVITPSSAKTIHFYKTCEEAVNMPEYFIEDEKLFTCQRVRASTWTANKRWERLSHDEVTVDIIKFKEKGTFLVIKKDQDYKFIGKLTKEWKCRKSAGNDIQISVPPQLVIASIIDNSQDSILSLRCVAGDKLCAMIQGFGRGNSPITPGITEDIKNLKISETDNHLKALIGNLIVTYYPTNNTNENAESRKGILEVYSQELNNVRIGIKLEIEYSDKTRHTFISPVKEIQRIGKHKISFKNLQVLEFESYAITDKVYKSMKTYA